MACLPAGESRIALLRPQAMQNREWTLVISTKSLRCRYDSTFHILADYDGSGSGAHRRNCVFSGKAIP